MCICKAKYAKVFMLFFKIFSAQFGSKYNEEAFKGLSQMPDKQIAALNFFMS